MMWMRMMILLSYSANQSADYNIDINYRYENYINSDTNFANRPPNIISDK